MAELMTLPSKITAGDTLSFTEIVPDYNPEDGWALSYALVNSVVQIVISSTDSGESSHLIEESASTTSAWLSGFFRWQSYVTKGAARHTVARGEIEIRPDFAAESDGVDGRGTWQTILDNLEAAYKKLTTTSATVVSVTYGERSTSYRSSEDLIVAISHARAQVKRERQEIALEEGSALGNRLIFRF